MKRLTEKDDLGNWCLKGVRWEQLRAGQVITKKVSEKLYGALCKLMRYEDTGLPPEDVSELHEFIRCPLNTALPAFHLPQWIPVEEQLPENPDETVLVQVSGRPKENIGFVDALQLAQYNPEEGWILEMYPEWEGAHPVAWMPLPEAYSPDH